MVRKKNLIPSNPSKKKKNFFCCCIILNTKPYINKLSTR